MAGVQNRRKLPASTALCSRLTLRSNNTTISNSLLFERASTLRKPVNTANRKRSGQAKYSCNRR